MTQPKEVIEDNRSRTNQFSRLPWARNSVDTPTFCEGFLRVIKSLREIWECRIHPTRPLIDIDFREQLTAFARGAAKSLKPRQGNIVLHHFR